MGDDDDGDAPLPVDLLQELQNGVRGLGVQGGGCLVAQQHLRVGGQGSGDGDALLLAAGELHRVGVRLVRQPHGFQQRHGPLFCLAPAHTGKLQGEADIVQRSPLVQQVKALENHGDFPPDGAKLLIGHGHQIPAVEQHLALIRPLQQIDAAHQRAFTRTGQADDAENFSRLHCHGYMLQRRHLALAGAKGLG